MRGRRVQQGGKRERPRKGILKGTRAKGGGREGRDGADECLLRAFSY